MGLLSCRLVSLMIVAGLLCVFGRLVAGRQTDPPKAAGAD
jgi:hypothetical protein